MRVLIADPRSDVRWALRTVLGEESDVRVVGEASDAQTLLAQNQAHHPDLVLFDWELPGPPLAELLPALRTGAEGSGGPLSVIVLSVLPEIETLALLAGADAFVCKAEPPEHLLTALRRMNRP